MRRILITEESDASGNPLISWGDVAGSVGNFGTILPLFFAVSLTTGMPLSLMLLLCGGWYIISGLIYQIPIPVEPLKAIAAVAIAEQISPGMIAASGILIGLLFLILGLSKGMQRMREWIPLAVIRGIQLGLGLILLRSAIFSFGLQDPFFFLVCIGIIILFLLIRHIRDVPDLSALCILGLGVGVVIHTIGIPVIAFPRLPILIIPNLTEYLNAGVLLVIPQIPLTLANAVLATSLLATELYNRPVSPDKLSLTIGIMSLSTSMLGGFPMCHGAGGVAAHYRFGARHGSALIIGGIILIVASTLLTNPKTLDAIPDGVFGALLLAVAIELIKHGAKTDNRLITGIIAILAIPAGIAPAFGGGLIMSAIFRYHSHKAKNYTNIKEQ
ncbi:MAG: sulfate transporter [Methanomicrobiales archaeon HGW-Methanomicrobiales-4]|nr:MAG: sulfate transporter [Methanomicrobiales archaeon HGW-Methanomicrobiales-4]